MSYFTDFISLQEDFEVIDFIIYEKDIALDLFN
jgi:hypothetical protein